MRAVLILNPEAGDRLSNPEDLAKTSGQILKSLSSTGWEIGVQAITPELSGAAIARGAIGERVPVILVCGGDGTVSEVARELVHQPVTLGILPLGTFNNLARSIGVLGELDEACAVIRAGISCPIDVGIANEERFFFEAAGAGLDAELFPLGEEIKQGHWHRFWPVVLTTLRFRPRVFEIELDCPTTDSGRRHQAGEPLRLRRRALFVVGANGPFYAGAMGVAPGARVNDGSLTLSIYRNFTLWELIWHMRAIRCGRFKDSPKVEIYRAKEIRIRSRRKVAVHVDGKPAGVTPLRLRVIPKALRVFVPACQTQVPPESNESIDRTAAPSPELLSGAIETIQSDRDAVRALDTMERAVGEQTESEVVKKELDKTPVEQMEALDKAASKQKGSERAGALFTEVAKQSVAESGEFRAQSDQAIKEVNRRASVNGHSAAAFAGAVLLGDQYPRYRTQFLGVASLVAFSRVYLGAHYPGDVLSGSICGVILARVYRAILSRLGLIGRP